MKELQYDTFYKFIVSIGVVLFIAPIVGIYYLLSETFDMIITKDEFKELNIISKKIITNKSEWLNTINRIAPYLLVLMMISGLVLIIWGCIRWYKMQLFLDKEVKLNILEKQINLEKMTTVEVLKKALHDSDDNDVSESDEEIEDEEDEEDEEIEDEENKKDEVDKENKEDKEEKEEDVEDGSPQTINKEYSRVMEYLAVEKACYNMISRKNSNSYKVMRNVKVGSFEYDILAISQKDNIDLLVEVKYYRELHHPRINQLMRDLNLRGIDYENNTNRNFRILLIVVTDNSEDEIKTYGEKYIRNDNAHYAFVDFEVYNKTRFLKDYSKQF